MPAKTRLFFATDVHGSDKSFRKFVSAGKLYKADVVVLGGDITGKGVVPIIERDDGSFGCDYFGSPLILQNTEQLAETTRKIIDIGYYPYRTNTKEMEELRADSSRAKKVSEALMTERLEQWLSLAEEKLKGSSIRCFITGGNDDPFLIEPILNASDYAVNPENKVVHIDQIHEMISCAYGNPTPWKTPRELSEDELATRIEALCGGVRNMKNCIFNIHVPPIDSQLDTCPKLDTSKDPPQVITEGGQPVMMGAGSTAVRNAIEKHQPLVGLHGHIHEARAFAKIGRTHCLNPGSEYGEGILRGVIVNLAENKVASHQFVSG